MNDEGGEATFLIGLHLVWVDDAERPAGAGWPRTPRMSRMHASRETRRVVAGQKRGGVHVPRAAVLVMFRFAKLSLFL